MIPKIIVIMFPLVMFDVIQSKSHTMVFVVDLNLHMMH
jgi:hypothetical protein